MGEAHAIRDLLRFALVRRCSRLGRYRNRLSRRRHNPLDTAQPIDPGVVRVLDGKVATLTLDCFKGHVRTSSLSG